MTIKDVEEALEEVGKLRNGAKEKSGGKIDASYVLVRTSLAEKALIIFLKILKEKADVDSIFADTET